MAALHPHGLERYWLVALLLSTPVWAQPDLSSTSGNVEPQLEEVVVTAERRESNIQQTALSILAISNQTLSSQNVFQIQDLMTVLPQLQIQPHPNASNTLSLYLRGVGNSDEQILQDPSVGVYMDGVYLPRNIGLNLDLLDVERIEMLRGPQGTLYGRNATGGAINIVTPPPDNEFRSRITQGFGDNGHRRTMLSANLPLRENLAVRLSYGAFAQDGFIDTLPASSTRFGDLRKESGRFDIGWTPRGDFQLRYALDYHRADDVPGFIAAVPLYPARSIRPQFSKVGQSDTPENRVDSQGHTLTAEWSLSDSWVLTSISALRSIDDAQSQNFHQGVFGDSALLLTSAWGEQSMHSQELRLSNAHTDSRLILLTGLYQFQEDATRNAANLTPANNRRMLVFGRGIQNISRAIYSRASWTPNMFGERLTITTGVRLSADKRRATLQRGVQDLARGVTNLNPQLYTGNRSFRNISPELVMEFKIDDSRYMYIKSSRGHKSGGFNARASSVERFSQGFDDEHLLSTELGIKSEWLNRRLRLNAALFYGDYQDIQLNVQSDPNNIVLSDVLNAGGAAISGFEFDGSWIVGPGLQLDVNCSFLRTNLYDVRDANNINVADNYRLIGAPKQACSGSLDASRSLGAGLNLFGNVSYRIQSDTFGSATTAAGEYRIPGYGIWNLRLGLDVAINEATLQLASWLRNANDEQYYLSHFNGGAGKTVPSAIYGSEKTAGIDVTLRF
jgi:iron complex outermembrane recepter protein